MATRLLLIASLALIISGVSSRSENDSISQPTKGTVQELGGLKCYVSGSPASTVSVILISDVFGFETPHLRMIADEFAAARFYAVVPDFFNGEPYVSGGHFTPWLNKHKPEDGYKAALPVIKALKEKGITGFGAAGFCWGGKVAVDLLNYRYVQTAVLLHPTYTSAEDIQMVWLPTAIFGGENDKMAPPKLIKEFGDILKTRPTVDSLVKIYPNVEHGWTLRYNNTDRVGAKIAQRTQKDARNWLVKHLILRSNGIVMPLF